MCARRAASTVVSCCAICRKNGSGRGPCCSATRVGVSLELSRLPAELMTDARPESDPVIIKKYANRRPSNTDSYSNLTLEHLAAMTRDASAFKETDAHSGAHHPNTTPTKPNHAEDYTHPTPL